MTRLWGQKPVAALQLHISHDILLTFHQWLTTGEFPSALTIPQSFTLYSIAREWSIPTLQTAVRLKLAKILQNLTRAGDWQALTEFAQGEVDTAMHGTLPWSPVPT